MLNNRCFVSLTSSAEAFGVRTCGSFYEGVGAVRDVFQNHLLQVLSLLTMERPADGDGPAIDAARVALLQAIGPPCQTDVVRGQYLGYRTEAGVAPAARVETYVAARRDDMAPYERLLVDAMRGDRTLFGSEAGVEAACRIVDPILDPNEPPDADDAGSWGPADAAQLAADAGGWITPSPGSDRPSSTP